MANYRDLHSTREQPAKVTATPQTQPIPGREKEMATNHAGGVVFTLNQWSMLDRFLILGSDQPTYYASAKKLTKDNAKNIMALLKEDGIRVVRRTVEISTEGRAPKNDSALFVLAMASADENVDVRRAALDALPKVARIGTHLMHFAEYVEGFRGWGRALKTAIGSWYNDKPIDNLIYQSIKYQNRDGWSNRDLLRLAHPKTSDETRNTVYRWIVQKPYETSLLPSRIQAFEELKSLDRKDIATACRLISENDLPREAIPTEFLSSAKIWETMLANGMPMTALVRNLGKISSLGMTDAYSEVTKTIVEQFGNAEAIQRARIHPLNVLAASKIYSQGHGDKGSLSWKPNQKIINALDNAFYASFKNADVTGKNHFIALDISGSMTGGGSNLGGLSPREISAAMSMVLIANEPNVEVYGFHNSLMELKLHGKQRLDDVVNYINRLGFGGTDCSLPAQFIAQKKLPVDVISIWTDSETYSGRMAPHEALVKARQATGRNIRQVVVGVTATNFTIADPKDPGELDIVGFDSGAINIISEFAKGTF